MPSGEEFDARVRARLLEGSVRYTTRRAHVAKLLEQARGPLSAAELHESLRGEVPLSTLYRTLTVLSNVGVLQRTHGGDGVARFELAEWLRGHHHHLVCVECGVVEDVDVTAADEELLRSFARRLAGRKGFAARGHQIDVEGVCGACAA